MCVCVCVCVCVCTHTHMQTHTCTLFITGEFFYGAIVIVPLGFKTC